MARRSATATKNRQAGHRRPGKTVERVMGRPTSLTDRTQDTIVGYLQDGLPIQTACALTGIGTATFYRWMERGEDARKTLDDEGSIPPEEDRFRDFREAVLTARALAERRAVNIIFKSMDGGHIISEEPILMLDGSPAIDPNTGQVLYKRTYSQPDGRLAIQYLQRARPMDWSQVMVNKTEVSGPGGGAVQVEHTVEQVVNLSERLAAVIEQKGMEADEDRLLGDTDEDGNLLGKDGHPVEDAEIVEG